MPKTFAISRSDKRIPMEVAVLISGHKITPGVENTFTENVSTRGARVVSVLRWETNDRLTLASRAGDFHSTARVAYCQTLRGAGYAVGVEFLEANGRWVVQPPSSPYPQ